MSMLLAWIYVKVGFRCCWFETVANSWQNCNQMKLFEMQNVKTTKRSYRSKGWKSSARETAHNPSTLELHNSQIIRPKTQPISFTANVPNHFRVIHRKKQQEKKRHTSRNKFVEKFVTKHIKWWGIDVYYISWLDRCLIVMSFIKSYYYLNWLKTNVHFLHVFCLSISFWRHVFFYIYIQRYKCKLHVISKWTKRCCIWWAMRYCGSIEPSSIRISLRLS